MGREKFTFQGLDPIEKRLKRLAEDVDYITVTDRTDRKHEEMLGRFELTLADALPYLDDTPSWDDLDDDVEDADDGVGSAFGELDAEDEDEPGDVAPEPEVRDAESDAVRYATAACRWLRDIATRNTVGESYRRFRMKAYGPKGVRVVDTGSFLCRNESFDLDLPLGAVPQGPSADSALQIPTPTFEQVETKGAAKGIQALGDYYAQWGRIVLGSMGQLQHVNNDMLARLHRQLQDSRGQVDELVAAILEFRAAEMKVGADKAAEERANDTRTMLAQQALQQLGEAAKAFLAAKGVSPEMADVLGAISQSPDLVAALGDPDVKALMQEPANLKALAGMLKGAAAQARAVREAANAPGVPTPEPAHQSAAG